MKTWKLFWAPEGRMIGEVRAITYAAAVHKAPMPWGKFPGEIYVEAQ